jgi:hypothetical protein
MARPMKKSLKMAGVIGTWQFDIASAPRPALQMEKDRFQH